MTKKLKKPCGTKKQFAPARSKDPISGPGKQKSDDSSTLSHHPNPSEPQNKKKQKQKQKNKKKHKSHVEQQKKQKRNHPAPARSEK